MVIYHRYYEVTIVGFGTIQEIMLEPRYIFLAVGMSSNFSTLMGFFKYLGYPIFTFVTASYLTLGEVGTVPFN